MLNLYVRIAAELPPKRKICASLKRCDLQPISALNRESTRAMH